MFDKVYGLVTLPGAAKPLPSVVYSIVEAYSGDFRFFERDLNAKTLTAFRRCVTPERFVYAIDVQHEDYRFYPHRSFNSDDREAWRVPVLPDGDYFVFLAEDLSFGTFGHPWEQTMCVWGQPLLDAFALDMPLLFTEIVRENR